MWIIPSIIIISYGFTIWMQYIFNTKNRYFFGISYTNYLLIITGVIITLAVTRFQWYYYRVYPSRAANDWQAATLHHLAIINREKNNYAQVYLAGLDHEYQSQNYQFNKLDNVNFHTTFSTLTFDQPIFILGKAAVIIDGLKEHFPDKSYQVLYDFTEYGTDYLGVSIP